MSLLCVNLNNVDPSVCAMHSQTLDNFQLFRGDIVKLKSATKSSVLVCLSDDNIGFGDIGIPEEARKNVGASTGDQIELEAALDIAYGKRVKFAVEHAEVCPPLK